MEIMVPSNTDFIFDSAQSTPFVSAPSSPRPFGAGDPFDCYYHHYMTSAPTSPSRVAARAHNPDDFAFDFGGGRPGEGTGDLTAADELFEEGKIRPLKPKPPPPPRARHEKGGGNAASSPRSPASPFAAAATRERGRERSSASSYSAVPSASSSRSRKGSRSLSPMRRSRGAATAGVAPTTIGAECLKSNSGGGGGGGKKWRLKDLLLFRSASEGRVTGNKSKDPLGKYTIVSSSSSSLFSKKGGEDSRNSSFRSTESSGSSTRRSPASAHEMHYKSNRAAAEEMKKKTALPFNRHGFFGCLSFNPAVNGVAKSFHDSCSSFDRRR